MLGYQEYLTGHPEMFRKIILFLLLWHSFLAYAMPNEPVSLKLDSELGGAETIPAITIYHDDKYDNTTNFRLSTRPAKTFLSLKLTSEEIDESRIGKISEKERIALLKKQKQIYQDKQSSSFSITGNKIESSKTANGTNRLQHFAWHSESTPSNPQIVKASLTQATAEHTNNSIEIKQNHPRKTEQTELQQTELTWQVGGQVALGLALFYLAGRIGLRYSFQAKPRVQLALALSTHQAQPSAESTPRIEESLMLPSTSMEISPEVESLVEHAMSLNTQQSHLSIEAVRPMDDGWAPSTSMRIPTVALQPLELPIYPKNLIEISPVVRPIINTIRNLAPPPLPSHQSKIVGEEEMPDTVNLLADFNPKKYESSKAFLESRKALTIEQIIEWSKRVTGSQQSLPMIHKFG